jgi:NADH-quinone oxidoreductase subunit E
MVQIWKDTYEDLSPAGLEAILDMFEAGETPVPGPQNGRTASCPEGGPTTLTDAALYDGSTIGAWKKRFDETSDVAPAPAAAASAPTVAPSPPASASPKNPPRSLRWPTRDS